MPNVYVCDANSGAFVAYTVQYNATLYKAATASELKFVPLDAGKARTINLGEE